MAEVVFGYVRVWRPVVGFESDGVDGLRGALADLGLDGSGIDEIPQG